MTAYLPFPRDFLGRVATLIINEVHGINGVVYDITSKHTGTIEWAFRGPPLLDRKILGRRVEAGVNSLGSAPRESTIDRRLRTTR
jgi:hypothetical protein